MVYSLELKEIFKKLSKETNPGKPIMAIDAVLKIMEKYYTEEAVEDLSVTVFIKDNYKDREKFGKLIDDLISLQAEEGAKYVGNNITSENAGDPTFTKMIGKAEEEALNHKQAPIPIVSAFHVLLGAMEVDQKIDDIFRSHGASKEELIKANDGNQGIFNDINNFVSKMMGVNIDSTGDRTKISFEVDPGEFEDDDDEEEDERAFDPQEFMESIGFPLAHGEEGRSGKNGSKTPMLDKYAKDLTKEDLDPVYGRESELTQLLEILGCKKKNNAILIGEPGTGKTSVVELLATRIKNQEVPKKFIGKKIYSLDLNSLVAGTKYRGQYEERLQGIIEEVISNPEIIVFIDEIHNLIGNGSSEGAGDAANILKPYLAKGKFQCIGSTTFKEYRKFIEKDGALKRRFQNVMISEPTPDETKVILKNIKGIYEKHHNVTYPKDVLEACVDLSGRYMTDRNFPDKAIDALDLSGSLARLTISEAGTEEYLKLKKELQDTQDAKNKAVGEENFEEAIVQRNKATEITKALDAKEKSVKVSLEDVYKAIGKRSGVPIDSIGASDLDKLRKLNTILKKNVIGQEEAIKEVVMSLQKNSLSIRDPKKPIASLLFVGPTGSGKTYLCQTLAKEFFGTPDALIKFDMSEYGEKHEITKLTGASASFVGYDDEPAFEQVRKHPYSVVLFDEIEKAAPEIYQIFLSILDEGYVTLANGTKVNFKNTIIIFTGNIGTKELTLYGGGIGYGSDTREAQEKKKDQIINKAIEKQFAPEFINRLSKIVIFSSLTQDNLLKISDLEITKLAKRLWTQKIKLQVTKALKEYIISKCDLKYGARDLQRNITRYIEERICEELLCNENIPDGKKTFALDVREGDVEVQVK